MAEALDAGQAALVRRADAFFIASAHPERGADASHRGGEPGFVEVSNDGRELVFPDYSGNRMFQTLSNLAVDPRAGLLFLGRDTGSALQLTGDARIVWDEEALVSRPGAERLVAFQSTQVRESEEAQEARGHPQRDLFEFECDCRQPEIEGAVLIRHHRPAVSDLPELVRAYVERSLGAEPGPLSAVRLQQVGEMVLKPGAKPRRFNATEEFALDRVAFAWRARFPMFGPVSLRVIDSYDGSDGTLEARLLGLPLQRKRGPDLAQGEAFRYLAEIAWIPHAILANPQLIWREVDERTVEVATNVHNEQIAVQLVFDEEGDISQTVAERPRLEAAGARTRWIGEYTAYKKLNGVRLPTQGQVSWELPAGPFVYWRATITSLDLADRDRLLASNR